MRLPSGYSNLSGDIGKTIRAARKSLNLKQEALAADVGIRRETLSRIETGKEVPRLQVLDVLLAELGIEWDEIAERGSSSCPPLIFQEGRRGDSLVEIGREVRDRRGSTSLRTLGERVGISAAQLSRLERGQVSRSRIFRDHPDDMIFDHEHRRIEIVDSKLKAFLEGD